MKILVINAGSSSLKYQLIDMETERAIAKGVCERIGQAGSVLKHKAGRELEKLAPMPDHDAAVKLVLDVLVDKAYGVIGNMSEIGAVGHRVVHCGEDYDSSQLITDAVMGVCVQNSEFAPLHNPANIMGVNACLRAMPETPMAAVFDNAFHATMPARAHLYAIPYEDYQQYKIRKYGFHGTSHLYVSQEAANILGRPVEELKIITCHLGNGASVAAVKGGKSVDTS
ncbi:MAG: acetate kinase, partial [Firmicutes bacterium]|nr:acetate kinase [Bacillota bacterium]